MRTGTLFAGRYRIQRVLGRGASGRLLLAADTWQGAHPVAVKVAENAGDGGRPGPLETEFRVLRDIAHPLIVMAHDFARLPDGRPYFTLDFVDGLDLGAAWRKLAATRVLDALVDVCAALHHIHRCGYVHGDLKPENLLVARSGWPVLVDFGHAAPIGARALRVRGTRGYLAPEVVRGGRVDPRSDLYALGAMLRDLERAAGAIGLGDLVADLTASRPAQRPVDARAVAARLTALRARRAVRTARSPRRGPEWTRLPLQPRFVGRSEERQHLGQALDAMLARREPRMVAVSGPVGSGRRRLLETFKTTCQLRDCLVLELQSASGSAVSAPTHPLGGFLGRLCQALPPDRSTVLSCGPELMKQAPALAELPAFAAHRRGLQRALRTAGTLPPPAERRRRIERTAEFVVREAARRALVLILPEADEASADVCDLLAALAHRAEGAVLACLTLPPSGAAMDLLRAWDRAGRVESLELSGLSREETARLIGQLGLPPEAIDPIHDRTGGHPGRLIDIARAVRLRERMPHGPADWVRLIEAVERAAHAMPAHRPADRSSARALELLALAARPLAQTTLVSAWRASFRGRSASGRLHPGADTMLFALRQARILTRHRGATGWMWDFADPRHAAHLASALSPRVRRERFRALVAGQRSFLRTLAPASPVHAQAAAQLALYHLHAGDTARALRAARRAAARLQALASPRSALDLLREVLPAALRARGSEKPGPRELRRGLAEAADLAMQVGDARGEAMWLERLRSRRHWRELDGLARARVGRRCSVLALMHGRLPDALGHLAGAHRSLAARPRRDARRRREALRLGALEAMLAIRRGRPAEALHAADLALGQISDASRFELEQASLLNWRAIAQIYSGRARDAVRSWHAARRAFRRAEDPVGEAGVLNNLGKFHMDRGELPAARRALEQARLRRLRLGDTDGVADSLNNLGIVALTAGLPNEARPMLEESLWLRRRIGDAFGAMLARANLAEVALLVGDYATAEAGLHAACVFMEAAGHGRLARGLRNSLALCMLGTGRMRKAGRLLETDEDAGAAPPDPLQGAITDLRRAEIALEQVRARRRSSARRRGEIRARLERAREAFQRLPAFHHLGMTLVRVVELEHLGPAPADPLPPAPQEAPLLNRLDELARDLDSGLLAAWLALLTGERLLWLGIQPHEARTACDRALLLARERGLREIVWRAHLGVARACRVAGQLRRAHNHLSEALGVLEDQQRTLPNARLRAGYLASCGRAQVREEIVRLAGCTGVAEQEVRPRDES